MPVANPPSETPRGGTFSIQEAGVPDDSVGVNGDVVMVKLSGIVYCREAGCYVAKMSLPQPAKGDPGTNGKRGSQFFGGIATQSALPSIDGTTVMVGDFAYLNDAGEIWRAE